MIYNVKVEWTNTDKEYYAVKADSKAEAEDFIRKTGRNARYVAVVHEIKRCYDAKTHEQIIQIA